MTDDGADRGPAALKFQPDTTSKKKKKVHRPVYADVFTQKPTEVNNLSHVHLFVNPYSGKKKGERIGELAKTLLEEAGKTVEMHLSSYSGHLIEIAKNLLLQNIPLDTISEATGFSITEIQKIQAK